VRSVLVEDEELVSLLSDLGPYVVV